MYARSSKSLALIIDHDINQYLHALSVDSQRLWIMLINTYYENYSTFEEGIFIKMLDDDMVRYYLDIMDALRKDKTPYNDEDMYKCIERIKEVSIDVDNKLLNQRIKNSNDGAEQSRLIDEKIRNRRKKEQLLKNRRK